MNSKGNLPLSSQIASRGSILALSCAAGLAVFLLTVFLQWLVYDDWMHSKGPLRLMGSLLAGMLMGIIVARRRFAARERKLEMLQRFETIKWMNDRIRNALQAIECVTYAASPDATAAVRSSVDSIEAVLQDVLAESHPSPRATSTRSPQNPTAADLQAR